MLTDRFQSDDYVRERASEGSSVACTLSLFTLFLSPFIFLPLFLSFCLFLPLLSLSFPPLPLSPLNYCLRYLLLTFYVADYSTVFLPWGPRWTATRVRHLMYTKVCISSPPRSFPPLSPPFVPLSHFAFLGPYPQFRMVRRKQESAHSPLFLRNRIPLSPFLSLSPLFLSLSLSFNYFLIKKKGTRGIKRLLRDVPARARHPTRPRPRDGHGQPLRARTPNLGRRESRRADDRIVPSYYGWRLDGGSMYLNKESGGGGKGGNGGKRSGQPLRARTAHVGRRESRRADDRLVPSHYGR
jgi:hypothetical protein